MVETLDIVGIGSTSLVEDESAWLSHRGSTIIGRERVPSGGKGVTGSTCEATNMGSSIKLRSRLGLGGEGIGSSELEGIGRRGKCFTKLKGDVGSTFRRRTVAQMMCCFCSPYLGRRPQAVQEGSSAELKESRRTGNPR